MPAHQPTGRRRRINGDGSVYKRQDGYWVGAFDVPTTSGARKRVVVYGRTLAEAREKLGKVQQQARTGIPVPDKVWKLGPYLDYWLENFVRRNRRPATYNLYEMIVRLYLKPGLGSRKLTSLTVPLVQEFLNGRLQQGDSIRKVQVMRTVLSAALTRAVREELIVRNVARLVELPQWQRGQIRPWAADEARAFLTAAKPDPLYTQAPGRTPGPLPHRHGIGLAGNRAGVHHPHRSAGRAAQLRPILPAHLRRQQDQDHQGAPRPAHGRIAAQRPRRPSPRRSDDPRPHPDQHHAGDLHRHRRAARRDALTRLQGLPDETSTDLLLHNCYRRLVRDLGTGSLGL